MDENHPLNANVFFTFTCQLKMTEWSECPSPAKCRL